MEYLFKSDMFMCQVSSEGTMGVTVTLWDLEHLIIRTFGHLCGGIPRVLTEERGPTLNVGDSDPQTGVRD